MIVAAGLSGLILVVAWLGFLWARGQLNDLDVPVVSTLGDVKSGETVMAIWAHPDDEITCAGTLARLSASGVRVVLVYLTRGEAARDTGYDRDALAQVRTLEARAAGDHLGAIHTEVLTWPDSGLSKTDMAQVLPVLRDLIGRFSPQVLISFDDRVGFYGHPDHVAVARWSRALAGEPGTPIRSLYQVTLPRALIAIALKFVAAFRDNYPTDPARGLPAPSHAVAIWSVAGRKRRLLDIHRSQARVIADVQPYYDRLPAWLYYRLFDREYFTQVDPAGLRPEPGQHA